MRYLRRRPSPSLVLSIIAVVAACAGTATAASVITGKQIRNSSITGQDIKDRSIGAKDLAKSAIPKSNASSSLPGVAGAAGPAGATGPAGPKGDTGDRGPSNAKMVHREADFTVDSPRFCPGPGVVICPAEPRGATLNVDAGQYVAFGTVQAEIPDGASINTLECTLSAPGMRDVASANMGDHGLEATAGRSGDQQRASLSTQVAFTAPAGGASPSLKCVGANLFAPEMITVRSVKLTAIQVGSVTAEAVTG